TVAEVVAVENAGFLEQADGAVNRGDRDLRIDLARALVQQLDVGVILALRQHAGDHPALLGNPEAAFGAQGLEVDRLVHLSPLLTKTAPSLWKRRGGFSTDTLLRQAAAFFRRPRFWPGLRPRPIFLARSRRFSA